MWKALGLIAAKRTKEEILTHATTWVSLKDIMLSEISQSQEDKYCMVPFM
jgi:hypothetical protein